MGDYEIILIISRRFLAEDFRHLTCLQQVGE